MRTRAWIVLFIFGLTASCNTPPASADAPPATGPVFNVKNAPYGAKGDGVGDDRAAIQRALDAARDAGGGEVYLPRGTYRVTLAPVVSGERALRRAFTVYANVRVRGEARDASVIKLADAQGGYGAIFAARTFGEDVTRLELRNFTVDHNTTNNPVNSLEDVALSEKDWARSNIRAALWVANGKNITVQGCAFTDIKAVWTVFIAGNAERVEGAVIDGNLLENVGGGSLDFDASQIYVEVNGAQSRITNNTITSRNGGAAGLLGLRTGIEVHGQNILVEGNTVKGFLYGLNIGGGWPTSGVVARKNAFLNANAGVVLWADADALKSAPDVVMTDVQVANNRISLDVAGWQGAPLGKNATFSGVTIEQQGDKDRQVQRLEITGNDIRFLNITGDAHKDGDRYSAGIHYNRAWNSNPNNLTTSLKMEGNTITDAPGMGVYVNAPVQNGTLSGNTIINPGSGTGASAWPGWQSGIFVQNRLEAFRVQNNRFSGAALKQGIYAINTVVGENLHSGNVVTDGNAPIFVRGKEDGTGDWVTR